MKRINITSRVNALEKATPAPEEAWVQVIVPDGLTPDQQEAFIVAEQAKLPAGTRLIVRRVV